jgi:hypothetical protein
MSSIASSLNSLGSSRPGTSASLNINDRNNSGIPPPPPIIHNNNNNTTTNHSLQQNLPNINVFTQRTLSYHAPKQQMVVPRGFFQWSFFIVAFPFRLIFSTLVDFAGFFCKINRKNDI